MEFLFVESLSNATDLPVKEGSKTAL